MSLYLQNAAIVNALSAGCRLHWHLCFGGGRETRQNTRMYCPDHSQLSSKRNPHAQHRCCHFVVVRVRFLCEHMCVCVSVCDPALPIPITTWMSGPNLPPSGVQMNNTNANSSAQYVFARVCVCASAQICARIPRIRAQIERVVQMRGTRWRTRVRNRACVCDWECIVHRVLESDTTCVSCTFRMHDRAFARG